MSLLKTVVSLQTEFIKLIGLKFSGRRGLSGKIRILYILISSIKETLILTSSRLNSRTVRSECCVYHQSKIELVKNCYDVWWTELN